MAEKKQDKGGKKRVLIIPGEEKGKSRTDFWRKLHGGEDYNPDRVGISTYGKMLNDPQVYAGMKILSLSIFAKGYDFKYPGQDKELGEKMRLYLHRAFKNVNRTLVNVGGVQDTFEAFTENAFSIGYSVSEIVYEEPANDGYIYMRKWKVLPAESLKNCFDTSVYGDLEKVTQFKGTDSEVTFSGEHDFSRLLVWSHNMKGGNWYGNSEFKRIYDDWYSKGYLIKFWNIALERYGAPFIVAYVNDEDALDDVVKHLDKARTKTNFGILEGNELKVLESKTNGMFGYRDAIKYHDEQIMRGMLIPTLVMGIEQTGARALGETHFDLFSWRIIELQNEFASVVQTLINRLIAINFGEQDEYPFITFPPLISKDKKILTEIVASLIDKGVISPKEGWIRNFLNIPQELETIDNNNKPPKEGDDDGEE